MNIKEKMRLERDGLMAYGPINIVAFGDSVTQGAFQLGQIDSDFAWCNLLGKRLRQISRYIPVNVINAGIGGTTAKERVDHVQKHVLSHDPDLVIVCFGLNDINGTLEDYLAALRSIFSQCSAVDTIFMTPNMLNTYVAQDIDPRLAEYGAVTAEFQNSGKMDSFMTAAKELARQMGVTVCDCYARWKTLSADRDTTLLLANRVNHPTKEMHQLFADSLFDVLDLTD